MPENYVDAGDDLSDSDIAPLCDIGEFAPGETRPERRAKRAAEPCRRGA
jgi:hypothetical protein